MSNQSKLRHLHAGTLYGMMASAPKAKSPFAGLSADSAWDEYSKNCAAVLPDHKSGFLNHYRDAWTESTLERLEAYGVDPSKLPGNHAFKVGWLYAMLAFNPCLEERFAGFRTADAAFEDYCGCLGFADGTLDAQSAFEEFRKGFREKWGKYLIKAMESTLRKEGPNE